MASARIGLAGFKSTGTYKYVTINDRGRDTLYYIDEVENAFYMLAGVSGGVGYTLPLKSTIEWYTMLKTGVVMGADVSGRIKNRYGMHADFSSGITLQHYLSLGFGLFYTNVWIEPNTRNQYRQHNIYNLLSGSAQIKLRFHYPKAG